MKKSAKKSKAAKRTVAKKAKTEKRAAARNAAKAKSKHETHYVCVGNCMGLAVEEKYKKGAKTCNVVVCSHYGKPLKKRHYCSACHIHYEPGKKHECF